MPTTTSADNVFTDGTEGVSFYGVLPITIDSTRELPYVQYAFVKRPADDKREAGSDGVELPSQYEDDANGPIFTMRFTIDRAVSLTADQFNQMITAVVHGFPAATGTHMRSVVEWDDDDSLVSVWATPGATHIFSPGRQYVVTTKPLPASTFNGLPPGIAYLSLMPSDVVNTYDGVGIGVLGVTYRFKLQEIVV